MNALLHAHPWLLFFVALFVVFILNAAACALSRAAALGDRQLSVPPRESVAGSDAPGPSELSLPVRADEFMRPWDIGAGIDGPDWGPR